MNGMEYDEWWGAMDIAGCDKCWGCDEWFDEWMDLWWMIESMTGT